jgi:hypothetical protein
MSEEVTLSTWYGRPLTRTEIQVFTFVEDERKAIMLSKFIVLPESATYEQIAEAVTMALVRLKVFAGEIADEERRDNRRATPKLKPN